jgi:hypothetical protein
MWRRVNENIKLCIYSREKTQTKKKKERGKRKKKKSRAEAYLEQLSKRI